MNSGDGFSQVRAADSAQRSRLIFIAVAIGFTAAVWVVRGAGFGMAAAAGAAILVCAAVLPERWRTRAAERPYLRWAFGFPALCLIEVSFHAKPTVWSVLGIVVASAIMTAWILGYIAWAKGRLTWPNRRWPARTANFLCLGLVTAFVLGDQGAPMMKTVIGSVIFSALIVLLGPPCWARLTAGHPRFAVRGRIIGKE